MVAKTGRKGAETQAGCLPPTAEIRQALTVIRQGGVVALPTETYYGLAVDPFNEEAVSRLFTLKKRPSAKPLLTLIANMSHLDRLTPEIPAVYLPLLDFWPGPLTLVFTAHPFLSPLVTGKTGTVGARISSHPLAQCLVRELDQPVTATSANISGLPAAITADEVRQAFGRHLDFIIDGGMTPGGKGSTLVGLQQGRLTLIRQGVISFAAIKEKVRLTQES